jgi:myosin heavy subunit
MEKSTDTFVQNLFPPEKKEKKIAVRPGQPNSKKITLGTQFKVTCYLEMKVTREKEQLYALMTIISSTEPHFIRAIKPNNVKKADFFEGATAVRQLRYSGLLETVRIRAAGFQYRPTYEECYKRFKILVNGTIEL